MYTGYYRLTTIIMQTKTKYIKFFYVVEIDL